MTRPTNDEQPSPHGWEVAFAWCPPEDSPLLGGEPGHGVDSPPKDQDEDQTDVTRRYDRMASLYDIYGAPMEWMGTRRRRRRLIARAEGRVLEVGVGTAKNLRHYPDGVHLSGIDLSKQMLQRASRRARRLGIPIDLGLADVHHLPYADETFDTTVATCVFCSVADPIGGLRELGRVTKRDGRILLLEHVRPRNRLLGRLADAVTVLTRRIFGFRANRRTEENVTAAGLRVVDIRREGIWREIEAGPSTARLGNATRGRQ